MKLAKLNGNEIAQYPYPRSSLKQEHPHISFPANLTSDALADFGAVIITETAQPETTSTQKAVEGQPHFDGAQWLQTWQIVELSAGEIAAALEQEREAMIVTQFQAKAALHLAGLLDAAETLMADPETDPIRAMEWKLKPTFRRNSATLIWAAAQLGLTEFQVDDLFRSGMSIEE